MQDDSRYDRGMWWFASTQFGPPSATPTAAPRREHTNHIATTANAPWLRVLAQILAAKRVE